MSQIVSGLGEMKKNFGRLLRAFDEKGQLDILMQGGKVLERGAKQRITQQGLIDTGNLRDSTIAEPDVGGKGVAVVVGPRGVVYAAIHEFGGVTHPKVTPRMRGFAWHMFEKTGNPMWRGLALTRKSHLTIRIPARPYMRPTFDEDGGHATRVIEDAAAAETRKLFGA